MAKTIGVDLGTTNSVVSYIDHNNQIQHVLFDQKQILPSCLYDNGKIQCIGERAKKRGMMDAANYIHSAKRNMENPDKIYHIGGIDLSAEDVAYEILKLIYDQVKDGDGIVDLVVTIPANYRQQASRATENAARKAGFRNVTLLREPVASVLAYGDKDGTYIVVDCGGGTTDISVIKVTGDNYDTVMTGGDPHLGGDDFTTAIQEMIEDEIASKDEYDYLNFTANYTDDPGLQNAYSSVNDYLKAKRKVYEAAERAKIALSSMMETTVDIPSLYKKNGAAVNFTMNIKRLEFENKAKRTFNNFRDVLDDTVKEMRRNGVNVKDLDQVIFAGGSMNVPKLKEITNDIFHKQPLDNDLDMIVANGAAVYANSKAMQTENNDPVHRTGKPVKITNKLLYNLGINVVSGELSPIIAKDTSYSSEIKCSRNYYTVYDNQTSIGASIYEGNELSNAKDPNNKEIGHFVIEGLPALKAGYAKILVTFILKENGWLYYKAEDVTDGNYPKAKTIENKLDWNSNRKQ